MGNEAREALEVPSDDETQVLELPAKIVVTKSPAEFVSMRCAILSELASELIRTNPPAEIQSALMLFAGELGSISAFSVAVIILLVRHHRAAQRRAEELRSWLRRDIEPEQLIKLASTLDRLSESDV
jgi:hypothetical protein